MANTPFLDLVKPAGTDKALVSVLNSNSDKIDNGVSTLSEQIAYTAITSGSMNSYTGNIGHTLYYKGSDISQFTDIPSATSGNAWPFVLEVIRMGPYAKQILHVFTTPTKMNNPPTFIRQQTYQSGSIVWGGWYSVDEQIATKTFDSDTLANVQTAIYNYVASMADGEQKSIRFGISSASGVFAATTYVGKLMRNSRTRFNISAQQSINNTRLILGRYKDGTWYWEQTASTDDVASDWTSCTDYKSSAESDANTLLMLYGKQRTLSFQGVVRTHAEGDVIMTFPAEHRPISGNPFGVGVINGVPVVLRLNGSNGQLTIYLINGATSSARLYFSMSWVVA